MTLKIEHSCIFVTDLERTRAFYETALQMKELRRKEGSDRYILFMGGEHTPHQLEIIQMKDRSEPWNLGENPTHLAFRADDIDAARAFHKALGYFHHEMTEFGVYFIADPDGYLSEIMPTRK